MEGASKDEGARTATGGDNALMQPIHVDASPGTGEAIPATPQSPDRTAPSPQPQSYQRELDHLLANCSDDDSVTDFAVAGLLSNLGQSFETFTSIIAERNRQKVGKSTRDDYLRATWDRASERNNRVTRIPLTDDEIDQLRTAFNDSAVAGLSRRRHDVLEWLVNEAIERRSWTILPGVAKIGKALSMDPSDVSRHLRVLAYDERLVNYRQMGGEYANLISLQPLVDPDTADPVDTLPRSRRLSAHPFDTRLTREQASKHLPPRPG